MFHIMVCISGYSGVGKDESAKRLIEKHGAIHTGLADPAKRHLADLYGFTRQQLYGPSQMRNAGDLRYPKELFSRYKLKLCDGPVPENVVGTVLPGKNYYWCDGFELEGMEAIPGADPSKPLWPKAPYLSLNSEDRRYFIVEQHPTFWLSPREALQVYCESLNGLYLDTWTCHGVETHKKLAEVTYFNEDVGGQKYVKYAYSYNRMIGLSCEDDGGPIQTDGFTITCFTDFRHKHEIRFVRQCISEKFIPIIVRVKHPRINRPPFNHRSETEQSTIPDDVFDYIIDNDGTIPDLYSKVDEMVSFIKAQKHNALTGKPLKAVS